MRVYPFFILLISSVANASPLFNFYVGSSWTYKVEVENEPSYTITNSVSEMKKMGGRNWYKLTEYGEFYWVANTEQGQVEALNLFNVSIEHLEEIEDIDEVLLFKYPAEVGETWNVYDDIITYQGQIKMDVPAGTFNCHLYFVDMEHGAYSKSCIAIDVGVVYNEAVFDDGVKETSWLIKYQH